MKMLEAGINRDVEAGRHRFGELFTGFEKLPAVRSIFGDETESVLQRLRVDVQSRWGYLRVDDETGNIVISGEYLKKGEERHIYLDVVHELVHVKQFMEGRELFDSRYSYVDRPTEIEAYRVCVEEAKRIGMKDGEIVEYLKIEWVTEEEFGRLVSSVGVRHKSNSPAGGH